MSLSQEASFVLSVYGAVALFFSVFSARSAALRGTKGTPFPRWVDVTFRITFLVLVLLPIFVWRLVPRWLLCMAFVLYLPSYVDNSERTGGRPYPPVRDWSVWYWFKRRLNLSVVRTVELDPNQQYIFGVHPHGILPFGSMINFGSNVNDALKLFNGIEFRVLAASFCFYIPGYRDLLLAGGVCDAARYCAQQLLTKYRKSIMLVPGGATEALYAWPGANVLVLRKRRGFVKLALQTGASLVPCYNFGENDTFDVLSSDWHTVRKMKELFQAVFGISLPLITNLIPNRCTSRSSSWQRLRFGDFITNIPTCPAPSATAVCYSQSRA